METKSIFKKDSRQTKALIKASKLASQTANRESRALGISVTYIKDGTIYEESAQGIITALKDIEQNSTAPFEIKKGLVLRAK